MAPWVFCNRCFQPPSGTSCFSLTNCGHVYCHACLGKGKKDECLICKVPCLTVILSKHTDSDIQSFFVGIDGLCRKYSRETAQISEFQEKHRKRLLAFYREKISKLEESLRRSVLQIEQLQRVEAMEVDLTPSPVRKPEGVAGPMRISLISPPQDGHMGSISYQGPQNLGLTPSQSMVKPLRVPPLQMPYRGRSQTPAYQCPGAAGKRSSPSLGSSQAVLPSRAPATRPPLSISGLLQRQRLG